VAAASGIEPRRWVLAFRPLRPLFRTEADELGPLLGDAGSPRFDDVTLYLDRLGSLAKRWAALDPAGYLGLSEIGDEAVTRACGFLANLESYAAASRVKSLYGTALGVASADSLKQRIAASVSRLNGFEHYACHFCQAREMELERSVVVTGKRETHRTYGFNSTTIHYNLRANIIPRCARCCDLHAYLWAVGKTMYTAMAIALAGFLVYRYLATPHEEITSVSVYVILTAIAVGVVYVFGLSARRIAALLGTPRGERRYWKVGSAKQYREMKSEGCSMTLDYRRNAFEELKRKSAH
jgi:hypothetical protein